MKDKVQRVEELLDKAASTHKSEDAIRFSQAALNTAHAIATVAEVERVKRLSSS